LGIYNKPPDPDVKAHKLLEIDDLCGSSLHLAHVQSGYEAALANAAAPAAIAVPTAPPAARSTKTTGHGASDRAHREEAAVRTLVHHGDTSESIYETLTRRGYQCAVQVPLEGGRVVVCSKHMDLKLFCSWSVHVEKVKTDTVDLFDVWSLQACN
jgi:hypothetical protein